MENIGGKIGMGILILALAVSGMSLIFEDQLTVLASFFNANGRETYDRTGRTLKIAYLFAPQNLNPFSTDPATQKRLLDVYEPLVRADENLNIQPVLAIDYGLYSETTWEFRLRGGVNFHSGRPLSADDVIFSFNQAKARPGSVAAELVDSVESITKTGGEKLLIVTKKPDPLLLIKLSKLPILPDGYDDFYHPDGTGSYMVTDSQNMEKLSYKRNEHYWGEKPFFGSVQILAMSDRKQRIDSLLNGEIDFLADVPPDAVEQIRENGGKLKFMPSLEVGFVMFNMVDKQFSMRPLRMAIAQALNRENFLDLAYGQATVINQFVSSGVFGFDPDLKGLAYDPAEAAQQLSKMISGFEKVTVGFYFPQNLKLLGQYFKEQLAVVGINVELHPLSDQELQNRLADGQLGFYYLGWRNDTGDALPFLKAVLHSKDKRGYGIYNGNQYENGTVDKLIEKSETNFNLKERLSDMQKVMRTVVLDDVIGVPLFETQSIFAYAPDLHFTPRVDSLIFPSSISILDL